MKLSINVVILANLVCYSPTSVLSANPDAATIERGKNALLHQNFWPATFPASSYENAWKRWGLKRRPVDFQKRFRERYGLHAAPYNNGKYPMGIRTAAQGRGIALDCLICHSGSIGGKSYVGMPNTSLEYQALVDELTPAGLQKPDFGGMKLTLVRGTAQAAAATVAAFSIRNADLSLRKQPLDLVIPKAVPEDPPAWWLLRKKKTTYHTGMGNARSSRSMMIFLLDPRNDLQEFQRAEKSFADIRAYLMTLKPPEYPYEIDQKQAAVGKMLFVKNCSECHGTYGANWTYPNRIIPQQQIGTDPARLNAYSKEFERHYTRSWFGRNHAFRGTDGYQAPPLDGIWATAPYLHNGSVPTVSHLLNSKTRPKIFTRSFQTGKEDYDSQRLGWKIQVLKNGPGPRLSPIDRRKIYDTRQAGQSNSGHTYGDHLKDGERDAIIEYLKTI